MGKVARPDRIGLCHLAGLYSMEQAIFPYWRIGRGRSFARALYAGQKAVYCMGQLGEAGKPGEGRLWRGSIELVGFEAVEGERLWRIPHILLSCQTYFKYSD